MTWFMSSVTLAFYVDAEDETEADNRMLEVFGSMPFGVSADVMENTSFERADDEDEED